MVSEFKKMQKLSMWAESSSSLTLSNVVGLVPLGFKVPEHQNFKIPLPSQQQTIERKTQTSVKWLMKCGVLVIVIKC